LKFLDRYLTIEYIGILLRFASSRSWAKMNPCACGKNFSTAEPRENRTLLVHFMAIIIIFNKNMYGTYDNKSVMRYIKRSRP